MNKLHLAWVKSVIAYMFASEKERYETDDALRPRIEEIQEYLKASPIREDLAIKCPAHPFVAIEDTVYVPRFLDFLSLGRNGSRLHLSAKGVQAGYRRHQYGSTSWEKAILIHWLYGEPLPAWFLKTTSKGKIRTVGLADKHLEFAEEIKTHSTEILQLIIEHMYKPTPYEPVPFVIKPCSEPTCNI